MICNKHNIEMNEVKETVPIFDNMGNIEYDSNGLPELVETIRYICPICEQEKDREFYSESSYIEGTNFVKQKIQELEEKNPNQKPINNDNTKPNFIEKYTPVIAKITDAPVDACKAMTQFLISCALYKVKYENSKGKILPNLSFIWVAPSGSNKTPLIENTILKMLPTVFQEFFEFGIVTGKGFRKEISTWRDEKMPIKPLAIIWDEMSTMAKDARHDGTSDLYEVLSEAYDGKLTPYTSVRGGHEKYPHLYSNLWLTGVPSFLENTDKSFWYQGFGLRSLFLKYEVAEIKDISDNSIVEIKTIYKQMEDDLTLMKNITFVKTTPEFMEQYNIFWKDTIKEIQNIQKDILRTEDPDMFPIISKVKYPVLIMKLAMINATARYNFRDDGILILDVQDFETAKKDLELYHKNMVDMFNIWQELVENKSKINNIKNLKNKIKRHMKTLMDDGKSFTLKRITNGDKTEFEAIKDINGKWIAHSSLLRLSHLTSKDFAEIIQTLIDQMFIVKRDGYIIKDGIKYPISFYSLT